MWRVSISQVASLSQKLGSWIWLAREGRGMGSLTALGQSTYSLIWAATVWKGITNEGHAFNPFPYSPNHDNAGK